MISSCMQVRELPLVSHIFSYQTTQASQATNPTEPGKLTFMSVTPLSTLASAVAQGVPGGSTQHSDALAALAPSPPGTQSTSVSAQLAIANEATFAANLPFSSAGGPNKNPARLKRQIDRRSSGHNTFGVPGEACLRCRPVLTQSPACGP